MPGTVAAQTPLLLQWWGWDDAGEKVMQLGPTVESHGDGRVRVDYQEGLVGLYPSFGAGLCVSVAWTDPGLPDFTSVGEAGAGVNAGVFATSEDRCAQEGWAWGADVSAGYVGAGASSASDPLPNDSGSLWETDSGNNQVRIGPSIGFLVSGGPSYTRAGGC